MAKKDALEIKIELGYIIIMNNLHWKSALKLIASTNGDDYILDHCYGEVNRNYFRLTHHGAPNIVICMETNIFKLA